jgi:hypothetical protein
VPKLVSIAISALQKMIVYKAVSVVSFIYLITRNAQSMVPKIMSRLSAQVTSTEESIQLKVLQALVAIATTLDLHDQQLGEVYRKFQENSYQKRSFAFASVCKPISRVPRFKTQQQLLLDSCSLCCTIEQ